MIVMITPLLRGGAVECEVAGVCQQACSLTHPAAPLKRGTARAGLSLLKFEGFKKELYYLRKLLFTRNPR